MRGGICAVINSEGSFYQSWWRPSMIPPQLDPRCSKEDGSWQTSPSPPSLPPDPPLPAGQSLLPPAPFQQLPRWARCWAQDGASQKEGLPFSWLLIQSSKHRWTQPPSSTQVTLSKVTASHGAHCPLSLSTRQQQAPSHSCSSWSHIHGHHLHRALVPLEPRRPGQGPSPGRDLL